MLPLSSITSASVDFDMVVFTTASRSSIVLSFICRDYRFKVESPQLVKEVFDSLRQ